MKVVVRPGLRKPLVISVYVRKKKIYNRNFFLPFRELGQIAYALAFLTKKHNNINNIVIYCSEPVYRLITGVISGNNYQKKIVRNILFLEKTLNTNFEFVVEERKVG